MYQSSKCTCEGTNENCFRCFGRGVFTPVKVKTGSKVKSSKKSHITNKKGRKKSTPADAAAVKLTTRKSKSFIFEDGKLITRVEMRLSRFEEIVAAQIEKGLTRNSGVIQKRVGPRNEPAKKSTNKKAMGHSENAADKHQIAVKTPKTGKTLSHLTLLDQGADVWTTPPLERHAGDQLDATKNIRIVVREGGKYGSHPSHDAMDDESSS